MPLAFDPRLARAVQAEALAPHQQPTPRPLRTAVDFRQQWMRKHPYLSEFHSRAEHLHAALLEGDPAVLAYVPQPFRLRIGVRRYTPDCYITNDAARRRVVELKPDGHLPEELRIPLTHFFAEHGMVFEVVASETVFAREIEAENWVEIVRILHQSRELSAPEAEQEVRERLACADRCSLGDLIDPGDRERTYMSEVALFRLLHAGQVTAELTERPLDLDTEITACI
ncbi:MAG: hypothetical protein WD382_07465 [Halofilum sp. (in: g-proteobacteria)]